MRFECPCGRLLDVDHPECALLIVPGKHYATLLEIERAIAALDPQGPEYDQKVRELALKQAAVRQRACECPRCGRIAWFREGPARPTVYWMDEE